MASFWTSWVAAHEILSSWPYVFSLNRWMLCSSATLARPHRHEVCLQEETHPNSAGLARRGCRSSGAHAPGKPGG